MAAIGGPPSTFPRETPMEGAIRNHAPRGEIISLNIDALDVDELDRRLEMALACADCVCCLCYSSCDCAALTSCGAFCETC